MHFGEDYRESLMRMEEEKDRGDARRLSLKSQAEFLRNKATP